MNDRELLELAAKAVGIKALRSPDGVLRDCTGGDPAMNIFAAKPWNPLEDDGDALRLAVKLRLVISPTNVTVMAYEPSTMRRGEVYELVGADPLAATRRAIVRAAAEIGRSMT